MDAFKFRKLLLKNSEKILGDVLDRNYYEKDPLTGEDWPPLSRTFNMYWAWLLKIAERPNDPLPDLPPPSEHIEQIERIISWMVEGRISSSDATGFIQPIMMLIDITELEQVKQMLIEANLNLNKD